MALTVTSAILDDISLAVAGKALAKGTADQQLGITRAADRALDVINQNGRAFGIIDADSPPAEWEQWLVRLGVYEASSQFMPERSGELRVAAQIAEDNALSSFSKFAVDSVDSSSIAFTVQQIRRYVMETCMNMQPRVKPSVALIDQEIQNTVMSVWNDAEWSFRRKRVTLSIAVDGTVTTTPSVVIGSIPDNKIKYTEDSPATTLNRTGYCFHVSDKEMNEYKAKTLTAGRPEAFRMLTAANAVVFVFSRTPDKVYTAEAEVVIRTPDISTIANIDSAIGIFPVEFQHVLKLKTLAGVLVTMGETGKADGSFRIADETIAALLPIYSDPGGDPANDSENPVFVRGLGPPPLGGMIGGGL